MACLNYFARNDVEITVMEYCGAGKKAESIAWKPFGEFKKAGQI